MAAVRVEDIWDTLNISDSDISEAKVQKMIKRAEVTELEEKPFLYVVRR